MNAFKTVDGAINHADRSKGNSLINLLTYFFKYDEFYYYDYIAYKNRRYK